MNHFCMISDEKFIRIHWSVWRASIPFVRVGGVRTPSCLGFPKPLEQVHTA